MKKSTFEIENVLELTLWIHHIFFYVNNFNEDNKLEKQTSCSSVLTLFKRFNDLKDLFKRLTLYLITRRQAAFLPNNNLTRTWYCIYFLILTSYEFVDFFLVILSQTSKSVFLRINHICCEMCESARVHYSSLSSEKTNLQLEKSLAKQKKLDYEKELVM